jgi:hypothetical protein
VGAGISKKAVSDWTMGFTKNKTLGIHNLTQTGKGLYTTPLCQKKGGSNEMKQKRIKMVGRTIHRTLSPKRAPFQTGIDG